MQLLINNFLSFSLFYVYFRTGTIGELYGKKRFFKTDIIRSPIAQYLIFIVATGDGGVKAIYADESVWLSQKMMGVLYNVETNTINNHLKKLFSDNELEEDSVIRNFRITVTYLE